jgi:hypothetical protein
MSTKQTNSLWLVRIHRPGKFGIVIPLSLAVLQETLYELSGWVGFWIRLLGLSRHRVGEMVRGLLQAGTEILWSLRRLGRMRMVDVDTQDVRVTVDLW